MKKTTTENSKGPMAIFGSSAEAQALKEALAHRFAVLHIPSQNARLAGVAAGRSDWMRPVICIEAAHPCDRHTQLMARRYARRFQAPLCIVDRPRWPCQEGEIEVQDFDVAMDHIPQGARIFQATGFEDAHRAEAYPHHLFWIRQIDRHRPSHFDHMTYLAAHPPFTPEDEAELFQTLRVTHLILRNSGGAGAMPKLIAARRIGMQVIFISCRRAPVTGHVGAAGDAVVRTVEEALKWTQTCTVINP